MLSTLSGCFGQARLAGAHPNWKTATCRRSGCSRVRRWGGAAGGRMVVASVKSEEEEKQEEAEETTTTATASVADVNKEVSAFAKKTAATFAPRSSTGQKNPAVKGSVLYQVFEWQSYISIVIGGLLAYNVIFPSDQPDIARLLGMWSIWIFVVPSLRARDCDPMEKEALNLAFVGIPLVNVLLPFVWKSFAAVYTADLILLAGLYSWKVWESDLVWPNNGPLSTSAHPRHAHM